MIYHELTFTQTNHITISAFTFIYNNTTQSLHFLNSNIKKETTKWTYIDAPAPYMLSFHLLIPISISNDEQFNYNYNCSYLHNYNCCALSDSQLPPVCPNLIYSSFVFKLMHPEVWKRRLPCQGGDSYCVHSVFTWRRFRGRVIGYSTVVL